MEERKSIFEIINDNVVAISEDANIMHKKIDSLYEKIERLTSALFPIVGESSIEEPKTIGTPDAEVEVK